MNAEKSLSGLDPLAQRLVKRIAETCGLTVANAASMMRSKTANIILEMLVVEKGLVEQTTIDGIKAREKAVNNKEVELARDSIRLKAEAEELNRKRQELDLLQERISGAETAEARDRIRLLQVYEQITEIKTCYDRTAFITGCAAILSGSPISVDGFDAERSDQHG